MAEAKKESKTKKVAKTKAKIVAETAPVDTEVKPELEIKADKPAAKAGKPTDSKPELAKAGKRSAKAKAVSEEKQAKEAKKTSAAAAKPTTKQSKPRTKLERAGKKYRDLAKLVDKTKSYELADAIELSIKTSPVKFDATIELHIRLNVDPKQADQNIRGVVALTSGSGKKLNIAVLDDTDSQGILPKLEKEELGFDVLITTPGMMPKLAVHARLLGPRGLMPSPKSGTVATDLKKAVAEAESGRVEYRVDQAGIIHLGIGKVSMGKDKLSANAEAIMAAIRSAKPASVKGVYLHSIFASSTMGPSIKVAV